MHLRLPLVTWPLSFGVLLGGADAQGKDGLAGALISEPLLVNGQEISNSLAKRLLIYSSADLRAYYARALVLKSVEVDTLDWSRRWGDLPVVGFEEPPPGGVGWASDILEQVYLEYAASTPSERFSNLAWRGVVQDVGAFEAFYAGPMAAWCPAARRAYDEIVGPLERVGYSPRAQEAAWLESRAVARSVACKRYFGRRAYERLSTNQQAAIDLCVQQRIGSGPMPCPPSLLRTLISELCRQRMGRTKSAIVDIADDLLFELWRAEKLEATIDLGAAWAFEVGQVSLSAAEDARRFVAGLVACDQALEAIGAPGSREASDYVKGLRRFQAWPQRGFGQFASVEFPCPEAREAALALRDRLRALMSSDERIFRAYHSNGLSSDTEQLRQILATRCLWDGTMKRVSFVLIPRREASLEAAYDLATTVAARLRGHPGEDDPFADERSYTKRRKDVVGECGLEVHRARLYDL